MPELFHLAEREFWEGAVAAGEYRMSTRGVTLEQQGFIHCSDRHQLGPVAEAIYSDADDLVLLVIDAERLSSPVRYEAPDGKPEEYPHIYGPLPVDAVIRVVPLHRNNGRLVFPD